ncbi:hypothetical protein IT417_00775 [bacterium]|nr:hypothetical protein [bacterium]
MIKNLISPFQKVLLGRRLCVGCTQPLDKAKKLGSLSTTKEVIECRCKRRYIYDLELNSFRRASFDEEKLFFMNKKQ